MPKYDFNKVAYISKNTSSQLLLDTYILAIVTRLPFCKKTHHCSFLKYNFPFYTLPVSVNHNHVKNIIWRNNPSSIITKVLQLQFFFTKVNFFVYFANTYLYLLPRRYSPVRCFKMLFHFYHRFHNKSLFVMNIFVFHSWFYILNINAIFTLSLLLRYYFF